MGTEAYMAPEQLDAKNVDPKADQYALAMMTYEMLSGGFPWAVGESSAHYGRKNDGRTTTVGSHDFRSKRDLECRHESPFIDPRGAL